MTADGFDTWGKICIVTGSAGGIGKEICRRLLSNKAKVCVSDVNEALGQETTKEFQEQYGNENVTFYRCNVTTQDDWEKMWNHTEQTFGETVQVLVNNAGVNPGLGWKPCIDIMLYGVMIGSFMARERMGRLKGGPGGRVINIASGAGLSVKPPRGLKAPLDDVGYNVSKHGVVAFTRMYSVSGGIENKKNVWEEDKIKAYALCPSFVDTAILGEEEKARTSGDNKSSKLSKLRTMTCKEIGDAFEDILDADKNGSIWLILPDIPIIEVPDMNGAMLLPSALYSKVVGFLRPNMKHIDAFYVLYVIIILSFLVFLFLMSILF